MSAGPTDLLLRTGLITSIELVGVVLALEEHFGVSISDSRVTPQNFATLETIRVLVHGLRMGSLSAAYSRVPLLGSMRRVLRCPLRALVLVLVLLWGLDSMTASLLARWGREAYWEFLECGQRAYPYAGGFSHDDFRFAIQQHEIRRNPSTSRINVLILGDSGTIGSFVPAEEAIPAQAGKALKEKGCNLRVLNLAWYGRLLAKDLMLLQLTLDGSTRSVVFTLGADYFSQTAVDRWTFAFEHISVNWPLYRDFCKRLPLSERGPFLEMEQRLRQADLRHGGPIRRWLFDNTALWHYRPFLQYLLRVKALPEYVGSGMRWTVERASHGRALRGSKASAVWDRVLPGDLDELQLSMLHSVIRYLREQGVGVVLYVEPAGPNSWRDGEQHPGRSAESIATELALETGAVVVDETWALDTGDFLESSAHYTPEANRRIGRDLAEAIARVSGGT